MGDKSPIEWTDATWNPVIGCKRVSAGCDHCYAFALHDQRHIAWKRGRMPSAPAQYHQPFSTVQLLPERLAQPLRWKKPRMVFVNSMSDLFHDDVPDEYIARVFAVMALCQQHTFQILTKRPERMRSLIGREAFLWAVRGRIAGMVVPRAQWRVRREAVPRWPLPNVWLGVSVEHQEAAEERIPLLLETPAAVRFLSCEPLLGLVDLDAFLWEEAGPAWAGCNLAEPGLDWLIAGGESGPHARPMDAEWARRLRNQCVSVGVPFFFKQWGGRTPKAGGRELDGRTWDEMPLVHQKKKEVARVSNS